MRWLKIFSVRVSEKSPRKKKKSDFITQYLAVSMLKSFPCGYLCFVMKKSIIKYKSRVLRAGRSLANSLLWNFSYRIIFSFWLTVSRPCLFEEDKKGP